MHIELEVQAHAEVADDGIVSTRREWMLIKTTGVPVGTKGAGGNAGG